MKIICFSDSHGNMPNLLGEFDLMLIAGDVAGYNGFVQQKQWWLVDFVEWFNDLNLKPTSKILITPGNHDCDSLFNSNTFLTELYQKTNYQVKILIDEEYVYSYLDGDEIKAIRIYGTPWCKLFGNWHFMKENSVLKRFFKDIPENIDILLTHDAPYGCSDICYESSWGNDHIGSLPLREAILEKKPKFCLHGHLHTSNHEPMFLEGTCVINTSISNESYQQVFKPLVLTESDLNYTINTDLNDEEYVFPNRYGYLIRLRKTGVDYTLDLPKDCHFQASYTLNDDKTYYSFDPEGGPMLIVGSRWFNFTIKSIKEINGELIFEIEKDGILNKD